MKLVETPQAGGRLTGRESVKGSKRLLELLIEGRVPESHPDYEAIVRALSAQGKFAALSVELTELGVRTASLSLNAQKAAADAELSNEYAGLDGLRLAALQAVAEARAKLPVKRGSKSWYLQEKKKLETANELLVDESQKLTKKLDGFLALGRQMAVQSGQAKIFDDELKKLLRKFEPRTLKAVP